MSICHKNRVHFHSENPRYAYVCRADEISVWSARVKETRSSSSSSSSRNEYYLGGIIALLLQDHRTMSTKSVCSSQYMVTDQQ